MVADSSLPILVVDDYQTMRKILRNLLAQIGYENVDEAANGEEALEKARSTTYGLIISDWNMAPMNGLDLLLRIRALPGYSDTPFMMVSAESKTDNLIAARKAGVTAYLMKPFTGASLKAKLDTLFPNVLMRME